MDERLGLPHPRPGYAGQPIGLQRRRRNSATNAFSFIRLDPQVDLTGLGMPGCTQSVAPIAEQLFLVSGARFSLPFALPSAPSFAGLPIRLQTLAFVPGANPLGAITSNGLELTLGQY